MEIACTLWVLKCTRIYVWSIQTWQHIHYTQTSNLSKSTINSLHCIMSILWRAAHDSKFPFHLWGEPVPLYPPSVPGSTFRQCSAFVNLSFPQTTWEQKKKKNWWRFLLWHRELLQHNLKCRGERARWAPKAKNWPTGKGESFCLVFPCGESHFMLNVIGYSCFWTQVAKPQVDASLGLAFNTVSYLVLSPDTT